MLPIETCGPGTGHSIPQTGQIDEVVLAMASAKASSMPENRNNMHLDTRMMLDILAPPQGSRNRRGTIGNLTSLLPLTPPETVLLCLSQRE